MLLVVGKRSDDQSLDSIQDLIPCEDTMCEDAARACHDVAACEDAIGEHLSH